MFIFILSVVEGVEQNLFFLSEDFELLGSDHSTDLSDISSILISVRMFTFKSRGSFGLRNSLFHRQIYTTGPIGQALLINNDYRV